jgi:hypothetical protein
MTTGAGVAANLPIASMIPKEKAWLSSTLCDNQRLSFVGVLPDKALKTIFPENYQLHLLFVTFPHL